MKLTITDAGRIADGYLKERKDCAVRALANATDIPYYQAHDIFRYGGRRNRCASYHTISTLSNIGINGTNCRMSLSSFLKMNPKGSFYIIKRGHAFAIKDGVVFDTFSLGGKVIIRWFAEIKKDLTR